MEATVRREDRGARHDADPRALCASPARYAASRGRSRGPRSASAEPFILPGESLSKYRAETSGYPELLHRSPPRPSLTSSPPPIRPTGWDGGLVLPGETLRASAASRSRVRESRDAHAAETATRRPWQRSRPRPRRPPRWPSSATAATAQPSAARRARPRRSRPSRRHLAARSRAIVQPFTDDARSFETAEHRDRLKPSSVAGRTEPKLTDESHEPMHRPRRSQRASQPRSSKPSKSSTKPPPSTSPERSLRLLPRRPRRPREFRQSAHRVEEVEEGKLVRPRPPSRRTIHQHPAHRRDDLRARTKLTEARTKSAAAPIEHEAAVQSVHLDEAETHRASPKPHDRRPTRNLFAPGDGELEEELLDDEEGDLRSLHAARHSTTSEEETLEHAADLGSMLRDMSIDDITRPEPDDDDEDDDFDDEMEEDELDSTEELDRLRRERRPEEEFAEAASSRRRRRRRRRRQLLRRRRHAKASAEAATDGEPAARAPRPRTPWQP